MASSRRTIAGILIVALSAAACRGADDPPDSASDSRPARAVSDTLHPDVLAAKATLESGGTWRFDVTLSSPYDTPERYADAFRVLAPDGRELGVRILTHDHAGEQPFTRSLEGVRIPADVTTVVVEGRDQVNGWGGKTLEIVLDRG